ncbi:hypothetical protein [Paenibacillus amylolyticus]|uniref:hypothetical protein n=1 Tax=Paenibacillus amylolyticus TaxID=1451 RepID=UPI00339B64AD
MSRVITIKNLDPVMQLNVTGDWGPAENSISYPGNRVEYTTIQGSKRYGISKGCNGYNHVLVTMEDNLHTSFIEKGRLRLTDDSNRPLEIPNECIKKYLNLYPYIGNESVDEILSYGRSFHYEPLYFFLNKKYHIILQRPDFEWLKCAAKFPYWQRMFERLTKFKIPDQCTNDELLQLMINHHEKNEQIDQVIFDLEFE